jgi:hypothetical protein
LDISGVFPEAFDKKRLATSGTSGYVGGIRNVVCHPTKQFVFVVWAGGAIQVWSYANLRKALLQKCGSDSDASGQQNEDGGDEPDDDDGKSSVGSGDPDVTKTLIKTLFLGVLRVVANALLSPKAILRPPASTDAMSPEPKAGAIGGGGGIAASTTQTGPVLVCDYTGQLAAVVWGENVGGLCVYDVRSGSILGGNTADNSTNITASNITVVNPVGMFLKFPDGWKPDSISFHPTDPILLNIVKRPNVQGCPALWCHSLLEPSLRLIGVHALETMVGNNECSTTRIDPLR